MTQDLKSSNVLEKTVILSNRIILDLQKVILILWKDIKIASYFHVFHCGVTGGFLTS